MIKSFYRSLVGWEIRCDYLRAHPQFHNSKRYDAVLFTSAGGKQLFARLVFIFKCEVCSLSEGKPCSEAYEFALVQPYNAPKGPLQVAEREMGLYRVRARLRKESYFIPSCTIIRGAVLVERYGQDFGDDDYYVMDDIDEDMFIRMQSFVY